MLEKNAPITAPRRRLPVVVASLLAIGLMASACGASTTEDTPSVAALPAAENEESAAAAEEDASEPDDSDDSGEVSEEEAELARLRFDQCMTDNGVDQDELFGDAADGTAVMIEGDDTDFEEQFEAYEAAFEECEPILADAFGDFEMSPEQEAELADIEAKFNQCMADKGFDIGSSDGEGGGAGISFEVEADGDGDFEAMEAAMDDCNEVFENSELFGEPDAEVDQ